jgi:hypothetical protein
MQPKQVIIRALCEEDKRQFNGYVIGNRGRLIAYASKHENNWYAGAVVEINGETKILEFVQLEEVK